jgi:hypothetical protein
MKTYIPSITKLLGFYFQVDFQFRSTTLKVFIAEITARIDAQSKMEWPNGKRPETRIAIAGAVKNLTINDLVYLDNLIPREQVDLILTGIDFDELLDNAFEKNEFFKRQKSDEYYEAITARGAPLVIAFIDNEPSD